MKNIYRFKNIIFFVNIKRNVLTTDSKNVFSINILYFILVFLTLLNLLNVLYLLNVLNLVIIYVYLSFGGILIVKKAKLAKTIIMPITAKNMAPESFFIIKAPAKFPNN